MSTKIPTITPHADIQLKPNYPISSLKEENLLSPPILKKIHRVFEIHGDRHLDEYHWLKDKNDPATRQYCEDWNQYTSQNMEPLQPLISKLYKEYVGRMETQSTSVPYQVGNYLYYHRTEENREHPIYCRTNLSNELEEVILDCNEFAKKFDCFDILEMEPSLDGTFISFSFDTDGSGCGTIYVKNMHTGKFLNEIVKNTKGQIVWNSLSTGFFYVQTNQELRPAIVYLHLIDPNSISDALIHKEKDPLFELEIEKDKLDRHLIITSASVDTSEIHIGSLDRPDSSMKVIHPKEVGLKYYLEMGDKEHYLRVSKDKSNWSLWKVKDENLSKEHWEVVIPSESSVDVIGVEVFKDYLAVLKLQEGLKKLEIWNLIDKQKMPVTMPQEMGYICLEYNLNFDTPLLRLRFDSPITPPSIFEYNMETSSLKLLKQQHVGNFDPKDYTCERIWTQAEDKTSIPISLFYKKGTSRDGKAPLYLYTYGAYGRPSEPRFSKGTLAFLQRGVCYAIAHVRGGGDLGRQWYLQGCMMNKKNSFTDFICCAEHLIKQQYTSSDRLVIRGRSAGGLVMGAVVNMRPDLFKACLAEVPFVDVITTMLDETLPLTTQEWEDWGNPNNEKHYHYMKSYSPVDNVKHQNYPSMLVVAGFKDKQVGIQEPAKWVAHLHEKKTNNTPLLFKVHMEGGHSGPSGLFGQIKENVHNFAFLLNQLGFKE